MPSSNFHIFGCGPDQATAHEESGQGQNGRRGVRVPRSAARFWSWIKASNDTLVGDFIGAACLVIFFVGGVFIAWGLECLNF